MVNTKGTIRIMCEIGIIAALGYVLDELQGIIFKGVFVNGGSIGFAMIAVLVMAFRRGFFPALLTGFIMGFLDVATSAQIIHPMQFLLDYIFPYAVVGIAGLLKPFFDRSGKKSCKIMWLVIGTIAGGLMKLLSHYFAGIVFWTDPNYFAWNLNEMNLFIYCFLYNMAFIGPSIIITAPLLVALHLTGPKIFNAEKIGFTDDDEKYNIAQKTISIATILGGGFLFIYFLIDYIKSFENNSAGDFIDYNFNPDSMMLFILGIFLIILGVFSLVSAFNNKFNSLVFIGSLIIFALISFMYSLTRLIAMYVKGLDPYLYWVWLIIGLISLLVYCTSFVIKIIKAKKNKSLNI